MSALGAMRPPQIEQGENVEPSAKAGLGHGETPPPGPGLRQAAAPEEHGAGLVQSAVAREIDVVETSRVRRALLGPVEFGLWGTFSQRQGPETRKAARRRPFPCAMRR